MTESNQNSQPSAETKPYFTIEEMVAAPMVWQVNVSSDGRKVAFVMRKADWDENRFVDQVFVYDTATSTKYQATSVASGAMSPKWSPDGTMLAYVSKGEAEAGPGKASGDSSAGGSNQLFVMTKDNHSGRQVTSLKSGVGTFKWAPDGSGFFVLANRKQEKLQQRKENFGDIEYVDVDDPGRKTLYFIPLDESLQDRDARYALPKDLRKEVRNHGGDSSTRPSDSVLGASDSATVSDSAELKPLLGRTDLHIQDFDVAPDGATVVFSAAPSTNFEDMQKTSFYLLNVKTGDVSELRTKGVVGSVVRLSPAGDEFVFTRQTGDEKMFRNSVLEIYNVGTHETRGIPVDIDEDLYPVVWTERGIVVQWQNRTNRWIEFVGRNGSREGLAIGVGVMAYDVSVSRDGHRAAWVQANTNEPADVVVDGERITDNLDFYRTKTTSSKKVLQWKASDGAEIEGVVSLPPNFEEGKRYPLLVVIHGGPTWASFPSATSNKYYPIEQFVEKGCIILEPNYRGSSGYGDAFRGLNERNLGVGDYDDVISGVDALIEKGWADKDKVGVMGWSQGGYISAFCTTYSDRFKAVSVGAGISNWMTYYVNTDIHPFTRHYLGDTPWNDPEVYAKTSPMTYINKASTPTLIQHGDKDSRVPVPNAFELYQGLRDVGVEVKLVIYKGMEHGSNKPGWNRAIMHQNLAWFSHYVLGESLDGFWLV